jgi:hypothetical protein
LFWNFEGADMKIEHEREKKGKKKKTFMPNWMTSGHMHCASRRGGWDDSNTIAEGGVW